MVYRGRVKGGVVVFEKGPELPEGTEVRIEPVAVPEKSPTEGRTLTEGFAENFWTRSGTIPKMKV